MRNFFKYFLLGMMIISLNGCGDSDGEDSLSINYMLDNGDFDGVIKALKNKPLQQTEDKVSLASAYMGKAGLSFSSLVTAMLPDDTEDNTSSKSNKFSNFMKNIADEFEKNAILDLRDASNYYLDILSDTNCSQAETLSDFDQDMCLLNGVVNITRTVTLMETLTSNIETFGNDKNESDLKLKASTCAMKYAFDGTITDNGCTIVDENKSIFFTQSEREYNLIDVTVKKNNKEEDFVYLVKGKYTVVTKDYCTLNSFERKVKEEISEGFYPCPVVESKDDGNNTEDVTALDSLVEVFNNGFDSVENLDVGEDVQKKIEDFKKEIDEQGKDKIDEDDIIDYMSKKNKDK